MKLNRLGFSLLVAAITLVGCQNDGDNNAAAPDNNNVEQTGYNDGTGTGTMNNPGNRQNGNLDQTGNTNQNGNINEDDGNINENGNGNDYEISDEAAEEITRQVEGIQNVYVVTTENNAYVAATFDKNGNDQNNTKNRDNNNENNQNKNTDNDDKLTDDMKRKVTDIVKSVDDNIENVYVSTNPDFADLVTNYADQAENGEPIEGLFDQMGNMIERIFPQD